MMEYGTIDNQYIQEKQFKYPVSKARPLEGGTSMLGPEGPAASLTFPLSQLCVSSRDGKRN